MIALDARGEELNVGDFVIDERGKAWRVEPTEKTIVASHVVYGTVVTARKGGNVRDGDPHRMVRIIAVYKVASLGPQTANRAEWKRLRASTSSDVARVAISQRRNSVPRAY